MRGIPYFHRNLICKQLQTTSASLNGPYYLSSMYSSAVDVNYVVLLILMVYLSFHSGYWFVTQLSKEAEIPMGRQSLFAVHM